MRSQVLLGYKVGRQASDLSDQLSAYYICRRRSTKWYRKVVFEFLFGIAIVSSYLIYKENYVASVVTILQFRESLVRSLLLHMPFEKLEPGPGQKSTSHWKRKHADHKLEEKEGSPRTVRSYCAGYYEKFR